MPILWNHRDATHRSTNGSAVLPSASPLPAAGPRCDVWEGLSGGAMLGHVKRQPIAAREHEHNQRPDGALVVGIGTRSLGKFSLAITQRSPSDVSPWSMMSVAVSQGYTRAVSGEVGRRWVPACEDDPLRVKLSSAVNTNSAAQMQAEMDCLEDSKKSDKGEPE